MRRYTFRFSATLLLFLPQWSLTLSCRWREERWLKLRSYMAFSRPLPLAQHRSCSEKKKKGTGESGKTGQQKNKQKKYRMAMPPLKLKKKKRINKWNTKKECTRRRKKKKVLPLYHYIIRQEKQNQKNKEELMTALSFFFNPHCAAWIYIDIDIHALGFFVRCTLVVEVSWYFRASSSVGIPFRAPLLKDVTTLPE